MLTGHHTVIPDLSARARTNVVCGSRSTLTELFAVLLAHRRQAPEILMQTLGFKFKTFHGGLA